MSAAPIIRRTDPAPLDDRADHAMVRMRDGVRDVHDRPARGRAGAGRAGGGASGRRLDRRVGARLRKALRRRARRRRSATTTRGVAWPGPRPGRRSRPAGAIRRSSACTCSTGPP